MVLKGEKSDEYVVCILPSNMQLWQMVLALCKQSSRVVGEFYFSFSQFLGSWEQLLGNTANPPNPGGPLTNFSGVCDRGSYFIPKKITTSEFFYPKKSLHFSAYPENPSVLFLQPKKSSFFRDPKKSRRLSSKKSPLPNFRPRKITQTPPPLSLKYVSGASGPPKHH